MKNPFRRRSPIRTTTEARMCRTVVMVAKLCAIEAVITGRMHQLDDLLIIENARRAAEGGDGNGRGGEMFHREVARLIHRHPSEGEI